MRVLVPVKRVIDPYVTIQVLKDESGVATDNVKHAMNPFDEIAMEQAATWLAAGQVSEIIAVSIGPDKATDVLRTALARDATRAIHIPMDVSPEPRLVAKLLAAIVKQEQIDMVIGGKQAIDDDSNQTLQMLAAYLNWPQATFASEIVLEATHATVLREVDGGLQRLKVTLPAVLSCDLRLNEPRHIPIPKIMKAKRKAIDTIAIDSLGVEMAASLHTKKVSVPPTRSKGVAVASVTELLDCLKNKEKVLS